MKFKSKIYWLLPLVWLSFLTACDKVEEVAGCQLDYNASDYQLVWSDEFEGSEINSDKWSFDIGNGCDIEIDPCHFELEEPAYLCGWGNNELQYYTDRNENARVENGNLIIEAKEELPFFMNTHPYTSARLVSKNKGDWKYGKMEIRAKLPTGKGLWPAIWMLPTENKYGTWPCSGEIDIMENIGSEPQTTFGTIHYGHEEWQFTSQEIRLEEGNFTDEFHTFSVLWNENCIQFYVDETEVGVPNTRTSVSPSTWPFDQKFHMLLNVAVGGNLPGNPDNTTTFPQKMEVDYVRVYQQAQ